MRSGASRRCAPPRSLSAVFCGPGWNRRAAAGVRDSMNWICMLLALAGGPSPGGRPFVEISNCGMLGCSWVIGVSQDGLVSIEIPRARHLSRRYRLPGRDFASFKASVARERPTELSGAVGDLTVDGPVREVRVDTGGRASSFRLYTTPSGLSLIYRSDPSDVSRALRVCEAVRALGGKGLASCVDAR
jgi:hypothetical protein